MRLAARDVVTALRALPATAADIRSPFGPSGKELIAPRRQGRADHLQGRRAARQRRRHRGARPARGRRGPGQVSGPDRRRGGRRERGPGRHRDDGPGLPQGRADVDPDHAAAAADRVRRADRGRHPGAAGRQRRDDHRVAARDPEPLAADRPGHLRGRADHRDGGRRRLHAVLPAPRTGGTGRGGIVPRCPAHRGRHLGPGHRGLRADRDDLAGRTALHRHRHVHRLRDRHDRASSAWPWPAR